MHLINQKRIWWILAIVIIAYIPYGFATSDVTDSSSLEPSVDLHLQNVKYPSSVNIGSELPLTFTIENKGSATSEKTNMQIMLSNNVAMILPDIIPSLEAGESIEITTTIQVPPHASRGKGFFQVIIDPSYQNRGYVSSHNSYYHSTLLILPEGMSAKRYKELTNPGPFTKITELNRDTGSSSACP